SLGATPVLALVVAFALVLVIDRAAAVVRLRPRVMTATASALAAVFVGWIGLVNLYTFFGPQMNDPTVCESFSTRETLPSRSARASFPRMGSSQQATKCCSAGPASRRSRDSPPVVATTARGA